MGNIIGWIFAGLIVGALARLLVPGKQGLGVLGTIALGIVGAIAGGAAARGIWGDTGDPLASGAWPGYMTAVLGAAILLWLVQKFTKRAA